MVIYDSAKIYIQSCTDVKSKITAIDKIIDALLLAQLDSAENAGRESYDLDDGQTKIKMHLRGPVDIARAINSYRMIRQQYINELNGHITRLSDESNFRRSF